MSTLNIWKVMKARWRHHLILKRPKKYHWSAKTTEHGNKHEGFDELFDMNVIKYDGNTVFSQEILCSKRPNVINGSLVFMTCNNSRCLPPKTVDFEIALH